MMINMALLVRIIEIAVGIGLATLGAKIGLRRLLLGTLAGLAGFSAITIVRAFYQPIALWLYKIMTYPTALVISLLVLTHVPLFLVWKLGRKLLVAAKVTESLSPTIDAMLGSGYIVTGYIVLLQIISF